MKFLGLVFIFIASFSNVNGQADSMNSFSLDGKKALLFQVTSNFTFTSLDGKLITIKKQISDKKAWRIGIDLTGYHTFGELNQYSDSVTTLYDDDKSHLDLSASWAIQNYLGRKRPLRFYLGYGLKVALLHHWNSNRSNPNDYFDDLRTGPIGFFGIEWFLNDQLGISGEYGSFLYYGYRREGHGFGNIYSYRSHGHTVGFSSEPVKLGLSVYFD